MIAGGNHTLISSMNHRRYIAYTVARNGCSGGNLPPTGPEGRNRGTFVFVSSNAKTFVIDEVVPFNQTGYICYGASPWRGWMRWVNAATLGVPWSYHSTPQVEYPTWRAADCRPYVNVPRF